jgi:hypothetical protein
MIRGGGEVNNAKNNVAIAVIITLLTSATLWY